MVSQGDILLQELTKKVDDFVFDHSIFPNAILLSVADIITLTEVDKEEVKNKLPTVACLIPIDCESLLDLPLPVLLPVVATKLQRKQVIILENKDL